MIIKQSKVGSLLCTKWMYVKWKKGMDINMAMKDMERMKALLEEKKAKAGFLENEKKIGSGKVEKRNKNIGLDFTRTKKISQ